MKDLLHEMLVEYFHDKEYAAESVEAWTKELCDSMKHRIKGSLRVLGYVCVLHLRRVSACK